MRVFVSLEPDGMFLKISLLTSPRSCGLPQIPHGANAQQIDNKILQEYYPVLLAP